ncbi:hypothetical protein H3C61_01760 [Candidatus Gracilibacteria bacterium]|nr:hypothetical protein [Candidatus Gracilibacteria bacterium]
MHIYTSPETSSQVFRRIFNDSNTCLGNSTLINEGIMVSGGHNMSSKLLNERLKFVSRVNGTLDSGRSKKEEPFGI